LSSGPRETSTFFGPSADEVEQLVPAVESAQNAAGLDVRRERTSQGFARLTVSDGQDATDVDIASRRGFSR
jgi:hypothetical protein